MGSTKVTRALLWAAVTVTAVACGDLSRDNPVDPKVSGGLSLRDQLLGSWSRDDAEKNEIYTFKVDGSIELRDFTNPSGGTVDRNATYPDTRVRIFEGTFQLVGDLLSITFTRAQSNEPGETLQVPVATKKAEIGISRNTLTLDETDGRRFYTRLP